MQELDLNNIWIDNDGNYPDHIKRDNSIIDPNHNIQVYFRNLETHLIKHIEQADAILGCIAWLTSGSILDVLATKEVVSLVVQKEDFLRPDMGAKSDWKNWLKSKYSALNCKIERYNFIDNIISRLSVCSDPTLDPIRCVGNCNQDKVPAFPRMHNKFIIFAKLLNVSEDEENSDFINVVPYAVWTGSFNLTKNAGRSLENALFIKDPEVVRAYYEEYGQIVAISEPLNWEKDWVKPQWRIGT